MINEALTAFWFLLKRNGGVVLKKSIYAVILAIVTMFGTVGFAQDNLSVFEHYTNVLKEEGKTPGEKYITRSEFIAVLMKQLKSILSQV